MYADDLEADKIKCIKTSGSIYLLKIEIVSKITRTCNFSKLSRSSKYFTAKRNWTKKDITNLRFDRLADKIIAKKIKSIKFSN